MVAKRRSSKVPKAIRKARKARRNTKASKSAFAYFVNGNEDLNPCSFGEIEFKSFVTRSTYSPYISCSPDTAPEVIWKLFFEHWHFTLPNFIISIAGEFTRRDTDWNTIMDDTWCITSGSSPSSFPSRSCIIGILRKNSVFQNKLLDTDHTDGLFPAVYDRRNRTSIKILPEGGGTLDHTHTHFIFVEGTEIQTCDFRAKLLDFIASFCLDHDHVGYEGRKCPGHRRDKKPTIPLVVMLLSDDKQCLMQVSRAAVRAHPVVIEKGANKVVQILWQNRNSENFKDNVFVGSYNSNTKEPKLEDELKTLTLNFNDLNEIDLITKGFQKWISERNKFIFYPSKNTKDLMTAFLKACRTFDLRSQIQLSLAWNRMDNVKTILHSPNHIRNNPTVTQMFLAMALSFNRVEFIVYLDELGISCTSSLTVKTLWSLYYQALYKPTMETATTTILREMVEKYPNNPTQLLRNMGRIVSHLTCHEVVDLYRDELFEYEGDLDAEESSGLTLNVFRVLDTEPVYVPHPELDLFLYCALMGKNELAVLFWKKGSYLPACALLASAVSDAIAKKIRKTVNDNAAESLKKCASFWLEMATDFVNHSYTLRKATTVCQLTQKVEQLGGCSSMSIASSCEIPPFFVLSAVQTALDHIWYGKTKQHQSNFKILAGITFPISIPWLNVLEKSDPTMADFQANCISKFSEVKCSEPKPVENPVGISKIINVFEDKQKEEIDFSKSNSIRNRFAYALGDIYNFLDSPRIKFYTNSFLLVFIIFLQCFCLLATETKPVTSSHVLLSFTILIATYMAGMLMQAIMEIATTPEDTIFRKFVNWHSSIWNKLDTVKFVCYFTGQGIMWSGAEDNGLWYAGKILLCIATFVLYLRVFQLYLVSRFLGPKVYMMSRMLQDLLAFLSIVLLVFFSYGTILTVLTNEPYKPREVDLQVGKLDDVIFIAYNSIIRIPYWQLYDNAMGNATHVHTTYPGLMRAMLTGFYMLFSNILMLNLLIAMFSYTFEVVQEQSHMFWCYHRLDVIEEYSEKSWIPSPFVILEYLVLIVQKMFGSGRVVTSPFKHELPKEYEEIIAEFEVEVLEEMRLKEIEENSHKYSLEGIENKLERVLQELDELKSK